MALKAILLDLDNTLYAYDPCNEAALRRVRNILNDASPIAWQDFRALHDDVRRELAVRLQNQAASHDRIIFFKEIAERLTGSPQPRQALELNHAYWQEFYQHMALAPEALRVLDALRGDFRLALVSNHTTEIQLEKIDRLGIADCFDAIVTSEEAGCEKPDRAIFQFALSRLDAAPDEAAMIGDHPVGDIAGARQAGIRAIYTRQFAGDGPPDLEADDQVDTIQDVLELLAG